jgi:hypothetical protein
LSLDGLGIKNTVKDLFQSIEEVSK